MRAVFVCCAAFVRRRASDVEASGAGRIIQNEVNSGVRRWPAARQLLFRDIIMRSFLPRRSIFALHGFEASRKRPSAISRVSCRFTGDNVLTGPARIAAKRRRFMPWDLSSAG